MKRLLTICAVAVLVHAVSGLAQAAVINVPTDYFSIQAAIDGASPGDTIQVSPGEYHENVKVNKQLNIYSTDGPSVTTVVASDPKDHVFEFTADYVAIDGFTVTGTEFKDYAGIYLNQVWYCDISNNVATSNGVGISLFGSLRNNVANNNTSSNQDCGIRLHGSSYNKVAGNNSNSNGNNGIWVLWSNENTLENNVTNSNEGGIFLGNARDTTMTNNQMAENAENFGVMGVAFPDVWKGEWTHSIDTSNTVDGKPIYYLMNTQGETIDGSTNAGCVVCIYCNDITVKDLTLCNNMWGVFFLETDNSVIQNNTISNNGYSGIALWRSDNNLVYHNNVIDNQPMDIWTEGNYWYHPTLLEGNYWSDYSGVDDGSGTGKHAIAGDGIGDTDIPWHYDYYPLVDTWANKIIVAIDIKPGSDPNPINQGSNGLVPVAILSSPEFDATAVIPETVCLGAATVAVRGKGKPMAHEEDVDGDGDIDLLVQVETQSLDDVGDSGIVILTGETTDGILIEGSDLVVIVPPE